MLDCPSCGAKTPKLIASTEDQKIMCPQCHKERGRMGFNLSLHDIVAQSQDGKHRLTRGKSAEIDSRYISPDDKTTVLSRDSGGKEARY